MVGDGVVLLATQLVSVLKKWILGCVILGFFDKAEEFFIDLLIGIMGRFHH